MRAETGAGKRSPLGRRAREAWVKAVLRPALDRIPELTRGLPHDKRRREGMIIEEDLTYGALRHPEQRLDVLSAAGTPEGAPALFYLHGGGFASCSKRTHIALALAYAQRGFVVFNVDYRRSPEHRYPIPLLDAAEALAFVLRHADRFGADPTKVVLAGESAGANLATALTVASRYRLDHPAASTLVPFGFRPKAVLAGCGVYQVTEIERLFSRAGGALSRQALLAMAEGYLGDEARLGEGHLADPITHLEGEGIHHGLPPFFVFCGQADPLLPESQRLAAALERRGAQVTLRTYEGEPHAFHALRWRKRARQAWADKDAFLAELGLP